MSLRFALFLCLTPLFTTPISNAADFVTYPGGEGPGKGKHVVFVSGDEEYRSEEGLPMLAKILSKRHGFRCTVLFALDPDGTVNPRNNTSLPGADQLDTADAMVLGLRFRKYPDAVMKHFADAHKRGIPVVGLRTSTHSFLQDKGSYRGYNNFGRETLGENWVSHWGSNHKYATRGIVADGAKGNELLSGVGEIFGDSGLYETHPQPDSTILLLGEVVNGLKTTDGPATHELTRRSDGKKQKANEPMMPLAWTRIAKLEGGKSNRVFCTTMGAATDLENEGLRRLIVNAVYWGFEMPIPAKADVTYVDAYEPTAYGDRTHRKGIRPEDHAMGKVLPEGK